MSSTDSSYPTHPATASRPLVQCSACGKEPKDVVESPCCGEVWCWQCAVERPALYCRCLCGRELALEDFRPAKAIQALLKRAATTTPRCGGAVWSRPHADIAHDLLPCPELCGVVARTNGRGHRVATYGEVAQPRSNNCYASGLKQKDVAAHMRDERPLASVPCRFGCDETVLRDNTEDNVALQLEQLHAKVEAQTTRLAQLEREARPTRRRGCMPHFDWAVMWTMAALYLVAVLVSVLANSSLMATLAVAGAVMKGLHWGFKRWAGRQRSPFKTAETKLLFAMLCTVIFSAICTIFSFCFT